MKPRAKSPSGTVHDTYGLSLEQLLNCSLRVRLRTSWDEHQVHAEPFVVLGGQRVIEVAWGDWIAAVRIRARERGVAI